MGFFVGHSERQLDPKGRLALPANFRPELEPSCFLTMGDDKCISVMTRADAESMLDEVRIDVKEGRQPKDALRVLALNMVAVTVDGQGRITVDEKLRTYAGLTPGSKVMVAGAIDRVEIWEPARFAEMSARGEAAIAGGAS